MCHVYVKLTFVTVDVFMVAKGLGKGQLKFLERIRVTFILVFVGFH